MVVSLHDDGVAVTPLNETVRFPWEAPNPTPVIVTVWPTAPDVGFTDVTTPVSVTRNV
jgi:hypothetical protein